MTTSECGEQCEECEECRNPPASGAQLVTVECLAAVSDGGQLHVPIGAHITPLAREEAWRRGIELSGGACATETAGAPRVAIGADHGGFALKQELGTWLRELGYRVLDLGTHDERACDYPDSARAVAEAVHDRRATLGVVVDGAGIGSAIAASKVPGVRAATCGCEASARNAREHNHANVLSLGSAYVGREEAHRILRAFLTTPCGAGRHARRAAKIDAIERDYARFQQVDGEGRPS